MKLTKKEENLDLGMNMTPMIDIVFQLIIFFMVVTELATLDLERMNLPYASNTDTESERIPGAFITVNVTRDTPLKDSEIKIKRRAYTQEKLIEFIKFEATLAGVVPNPSAPDKMISELQVLIRADRDARYEEVQRVFDACQKNGVWKTSVASTEEVHVKDAE